MTSSLVAPPGGEDGLVVDVPDEQLVREAQRGDTAAFEELVRRHAGLVHAVVRRLVDGGHEAEEVTQEAFVRAWRGIGRFKADAAFTTWLYRIAVNEALRRRAREPGRERQTSLDEQLVEPREHRPGPALVAQQRSLHAALERAIADLRPELRTPLLLRDVQGLSTAEAAQVMELGEAAFKSRLHRARLAVRSAIASYLPDEDDA
jgi:RNA polymerase sigma-70 factor (ECF subfamily)